MPVHPRCDGLKEELRVLKREAATGTAAHVDPSSGAVTGILAMGERVSTNESCTTLDEDEASSPSPLFQGKKRACDASGSAACSVKQNRFHTISDEGCEALKQATLKKAARSPTATGATELTTSDKHTCPGSGHSAGIKQKFSYLLVVDFECTCDSGEPNYPHEIIEFPVVAVETSTMRTVAEFQTFVRPVKNPILTDFCTELTGIHQDQVDSAPTMREALKLFDKWLLHELLPIIAKEKQRATVPKATSICQSKLGDGKTETTACEGTSVDAQAALDEIVQDLYRRMNEPSAASCSSSLPLIFVTDGPSDMRTFMFSCQVLRDGIDFPPFFYRWLNIRRGFADHFRTRPEHLIKMLRRLGMQFHGEHHRGIDDARNIARIAVALMQRGHRLQHVSSIPFETETMLDAQRRASDLMDELGSDSDVGQQKRRTNNQKEVKGTKKNRGHHR